MPAPILNAYIDKLEELHAEESLATATRVAVGSGALKRQTALRIQREWQKASGYKPPRVEVTNRQAMRSMVGMLGLPVRDVKREAADG